jgi:G3E family GTPase
VRLIVVAGFLGSGKTSLLLEIARHLVDRGRTVAVVENEIGEVGIDGRLIAERGLVVRELFGGCICCTLATGVVDALNSLGRTYGPDYVLLEPTGIAQPADLVATVEKYSAAVDGAVVLTVIDAERYGVLSEVVGPLLEGQIGQADVIAVNKRDAVPLAELDRVVAAVRVLGPAAPVLTVSALDHGSLDLLMENVL